MVPAPATRSRIPARAPGKCGQSAWAAEKTGQLGGDGLGAELLDTPIQLQKSRASTRVA